MKNEQWRFTDIRKINLESYCLDVPFSNEDVSRCLRFIEELSLPYLAAARLVFLNDRLIDYTRSVGSQGLICMPLSEAIKERPDLVQSSFEDDRASLGSQKFLYLQQAQGKSGAVVIFPRGLILEEPIEIHHFLTEDYASCFPRLLVIAEEQSQGEIVEFCHGLSRDQGGLCVGRSELILKPGANLRLIRTQNWGEKAQSYYVNASLLERDAALVTFILNLGSAYARTESKSRLVGSGARSDMLSLSVAHGVQEYDQRTYQDHIAAHTTSDLLYKNALCDGSRTIFSGMIRVEPEAQHTDAYQSNRNLLLSEEAEANSLPGLEIQANEVRCTHGATTGQIDPEQLFYLLSRGLSLKVARKLFIFGFFQDVFDRVGDPKLVGFLTQMIEDKLKSDID